MPAVSLYEGVVHTYVYVQVLTIKSAADQYSKNIYLSYNLLLQEGIFLQMTIPYKVMS